MLLRAQVLLLLLSFSGSAVAADLDRFAGQWRGVSIESSDGLDAVAEDFSLRFRAVRNGFELEWAAPGGAVEHARFEETKKQPGVFSPRVSKGGFLGLLSSGDLNPLAGDPLVWARFDANVFVVYKLVIDEGGAFTLDRYERSLQGDALVLRFTRRRHGEPERSLVARLERTG